MSGYRTGTADSTERQLADPRRAPGRATVPPPISAFQRLINIRHGTAVVTSRTTLSFPASSLAGPTDQLRLRASRLHRAPNSGVARIWREGAQNEMD